MPKSVFEQLFLDWESTPLLFLIPSCLIGLAYIRQLPRPMVILLAYLWFNLFIEISARFAALWFRQNLPLLHLYTLGEFCLFALFYQQILEKTSFFRQNARWIAGIMLLAIVGNTVFIQGIFEFNSYAKTLVQFTLVLFALEFAFTFTDEDFPASTERQSLRLINTAVLLYYVGSLYFFWFYLFLRKARSILKILWSANAALNALFHLLILIALCRIIYKLRK